MIGAGGVAVRRNRVAYSSEFHVPGNYNQYDSKWALEEIYVSGNDNYHYAWINLPWGGSPVKLKIDTVLNLRRYVPGNILHLIYQAAAAGNDEGLKIMKEIADKIGYTDGWTNGYVYSINLKFLEFNFVNQDERVLFELFPYSFGINGCSINCALEVLVGYLVVNRENLLRLLIRMGTDFSDLIYENGGFMYQI